MATEGTRDEPIEVDLDSDTVAKSIAAMRRFMCDVPAGDEQRGEETIISSRTWWLCTIANEAPRNYALLVWDNEVYQTTGGQPTATAARSSLAAIARGAGVDKAIEVRTEEELRRAFDRMLGEDGPFVVRVKVSKGRAEGRLDRDVVGHARRFAHALAALPPT